MEWMADRLAEMRARDLGRALRTVRGGAEPWLEIDGRRLLNLSSNNYLGLASHPEVVAGTSRVTQTDGCGAGSSRASPRRASDQAVWANLCALCSVTK